MFDLKDFKIPKDVWITKKINYKVSWVQRFPDPTQIGECDYDGKKIILKKDMNSFLTFFTFLHECVHALSEHRKLGMSEYQVNGLEHGFQIMVELNGWIKKTRVEKQPPRSRKT